MTTAATNYILRFHNNKAANTDIAVTYGVDVSGAPAKSNAINYKLTAATVNYTITPQPKEYDGTALANNFAAVHKNNNSGAVSTIRLVTTGTIEISDTATLTGYAKMTQAAITGTTEYDKVYINNIDTQLVFLKGSSETKNVADTETVGVRGTPALSGAQAGFYQIGTGNSPAGTITKATLKVIDITNDALAKSIDQFADVTLSTNMNKSSTAVTTGPSYVGTTPPVSAQFATKAGFGVQSGDVVFLNFKSNYISSAVASSGSDAGDIDVHVVHSGASDFSLDTTKGDGANYILEISEADLLLAVLDTNDVRQIGTVLGRSIVSITVNTPPTKVTYTYPDTALALAGMVITLDYGGGNKENFTYNTPAYNALGLTYYENTYNSANPSQTAITPWDIDTDNDGAANHPADAEDAELTVGTTKILIKHPAVSTPASQSVTVNPRVLIAGDFVALPNTIYAAKTYDNGINVLIQDNVTALSALFESKGGTPIGGTSESTFDPNAVGGHGQVITYIVDDAAPNGAVKYVLLPVIAKTYKDGDTSVGDTPETHAWIKVQLYYDNENVNGNEEETHTLKMKILGLVGPNKDNYKLSGTYAVNSVINQTSSNLIKRRPLNVSELYGADASAVTNNGDGTYTLIYTFPKTTEKVTVPGGGSTGGSTGGGGTGGGGATVTVPAEEYNVSYWLSTVGTSDDAIGEKVAKDETPVSVPTVVALNGYTFLGWSLDNPAKVKDPKIVNPKTVKITEDTTFYAIYKVPEKEYDHSHYVIGFPDGTFGPDNDITRGQVATIIARACLDGFVEGKNYGNPGGYTDVSTHWAYSAISYCFINNVFNGYEDGTFRPDNAITRQELATAVARLGEIQKNAGIPFTDKGDVASWAQDAVYTAYVNGWIKGYEDGTFLPTNDIKRSETVTILNSYLGRGVNKDGLSALNEYVHTGVASNLQSGDKAYMTWPDVPETHWAYYQIIEAANDHDYHRADENDATSLEVWETAKIDEIWRYHDDLEDGPERVNGVTNTTQTATQAAAEKAAAEKAAAEAAAKAEAEAKAAAEKAAAEAAAKAEAEAKAAAEAAAKAEAAAGATAGTVPSQTMTHRAYINGFPDGTFRPDEAITRAAVASVIAQTLLGGYDARMTYQTGFNDLEGHWARNYVAFCEGEGIFDSGDDGDFHPDQGISYQEFAAVIARLSDTAGNNAPDFSNSPSAGGLVTRAEAVKAFNDYLGRGVDYDGLAGVTGGTIWSDVSPNHWAYLEIVEAANDHTYHWNDASDPTPPERWETAGDI